MNESRLTESRKCSWCGLTITQHDIPRCRRCRAPLCTPYLRDCAYEHWRAAHLSNPRRVKDVPMTSEAL